ncbi:allergen Tha p 1-like [Frankliniella occidentalis]|uniref:Allergen Tha p 1-like n=1 Tax=Frankliniella occidentalis TaxID=133901 RepID=A0A6J1S3G5_FRAOC|nr:allergen Tha p 1-like [Frankliniella occidentalis]
MAANSSSSPMLLLQLAVLLAVAVLACGGAKQQQALREVRPRDVDLVLNNDALLNTFIRCLLEKGPCNQDGYQLRRLLPQTLETGCEKCTANHKQQSERVIRFLIARRPRDWKLLANKYDPKGEYERRFAPPGTPNTRA